MNDIQCLIDRQLGICNRLNYDSVLKRLVVNSEESFYGLQSSPLAVFDQDPPIFACRFSEAPGYENILALANEDGKVAIQDTSTVSSARNLEGFQCHNNAVFDLAWMPGSMNFVTVSGDHTACLWDVAEGSPQCVQVFSNHTRSVKTAVFRPNERTVFATGARDGHILVWDIRANNQPTVILKPDNCLWNCHSSFTPKTPGSHSKRARLDTHRATSITGLAFQDDATLISCGECDGNIKVWDLRKNYTIYKREPLPKRSIPYCGSSTKNGYTNLLVDEARVRLYASCMDGVVYCFNIAAYGALPERRYGGHENSSFYIKTCLSPDGRYLASGSSDAHAYVWDVRRPTPLLRLAAHRAEVTCVAWARAPAPTLATCSDDARHMLWRVDEGYDANPVRGRAESVPKAEPPLWPRGGGRDKTPDSLKRRRPTPSSGSCQAKKPRVAVASRIKRCLADSMEATESSVSPKRPRMDKSTLLTLEEEVSPPSASHRTPVKVSPLKVSPVKASPVKVKVITFTTPTKNLPDFVVDGEAPHLRLMSPVKRKRETTDWLTLIVREKRAKVCEAPPLSPKEAPPRRASTTERTPKSKCRTLLKYFTVADK